MRSIHAPSRWADYVAVVDQATRRADRRITVGRGAHALFQAPGDGLVYVTSRVDSRITGLDPETLDVKRVHEIGGGPDCLTFDAEGRIWATLRWVGRVANLDPGRGDVVALVCRVSRLRHHDVPGVLGWIVLLDLRLHAHRHGGA